MASFVETLSYTDPAEFERAVRIALGDIHRSDPHISDNGFEAEISEIMERGVLEGYGGGLRWVLTRPTLNDGQRRELHALGAVSNRAAGRPTIRAVYDTVGEGEV